ncbi:MAG TPA: hypothetical protein VMT88_10675 [Actinomycetes bacterium]|nr:hypothetical protein [Actinomycetes bacterium]
MRKYRDPELDSVPWTGPTRRYDIVKEGVIAILVVGLLTLSLAVLFSSPDDPVLTFKGWAESAPDNFFATTVSELAGTSESAGYGPPYNSAGDGLTVGPLNMQKIMGVRIPVDSANDFVITPLESQQQSTQVSQALQAWNDATPDQRSQWATAFDTAISDAEGNLTKVPSGDYGPVPALANGLVAMAASGAYDGILMAQGGFYQTDYTKQILFMGDGSYLDDAATAANLQGDTWGMMNETGSYPGQAWLWLYSAWYQIPPFNNEESAPFGANADAYIFYIMAGLTLGLIFLPFIPGLRSIPRWVPVHKLVWRDYYRNHRAR